jgi:dihydrofolate synthase/folylpolyglutamate synthase
MPSNNAYNEATTWLFSRFPSYQNIGASAYKPGLERVELLLDKLELDAKNIPSIHIAGTNGKGSTAAFCASMLQETGLRVGLFTSPHIFDFSERIRINGQVIDQDFVVEFCERIQSQLPNLDASFFELTFAMALAYFQAENCDWLVIETGLGGRLDATNVILPKLSIITNIALDHQEFLGNTIQEIASEKAGIMKKNVPVLIGEKNPETLGLFISSATATGAPIYFSEDFTMPAYLGEGYSGYTLKNLRNACAALQILGMTVKPEQFNTALKNLKKNTGHFGRFECLHEQPLVIADVSHNIDGILATLPMIQEKLKGELYILYGAAKDKNAREILDLFPKNAKVAACTFQNLRSKTKEDWQELGLEKIFADINFAKNEIQRQMHPNDLLWITGSFFLIADLKQE